MDHITDKLVSAIGDMDTAYLEEALDFDGAKTKTLRFPKLSAAVVAVLVILGLSVTAFAISRIPLSWRDIFPPVRPLSATKTRLRWSPSSSRSSRPCLRRKCRSRSKR